MPATSAGMTITGHAKQDMTDFVYEISCTGSGDREAAVQAWADRHAAPAWTALPGLTAVDLYRPLRGGTHDPFNNDGPGPLLMAMLQFSSKEKLRAGLSDPRFEQSLAGVPVAATGTSLERRFFPVAGAAEPGPLSAPFSYVVRYHHPADDVAAFIENYLATHPVTQARLPGIRSIMCYLPLDEISASGLVHAGSDLEAANYMIGNEVVFDHIEDFNAAMESPARHELRAHYHEFPRFAGANTHYPMIRSRLFG
jgi:hypothetical protein